MSFLVVLFIGFINVINVGDVIDKDICEKYDIFVYYFIVIYVGMIIYKSMRDIRGY